MSGAVSQSQFRPRVRFSVPSAAIPSGVQTGKARQYYRGPIAPVAGFGLGTVAGTMAVRRYTDQPASALKESPLPGGKSAAGDPGSLLWKP